MACCIYYCFGDVVNSFYYLPFTALDSYRFFIKTIEREKKIKHILFKGAEFMEAAEIPYMLGFGVLLNIIRDGKITTENDVDLMCLIEDLDLESENESKQTISRFCLGSFCHFDIKYEDEIGPLDIFQDGQY